MTSVTEEWANTVLIQRRKRMRLLTFWNAWENQIMEGAERERPGLSMGGNW